MPEIPGPESIIEKYGLKHDERFGCIENATLNFTRIVMNQSQGEPPEIYFSQKSRHAYLVFEGVVLNEGVTGRKGAFQDFSIEELKSKGSNQTALYLFWTLTNKMMAFRQQDVFSESTVMAAIPKLRELYIQLVQSQPIA